MPPPCSTARPHRSGGGRRLAHLTRRLDHVDAAAPARHQDAPVGLGAQLLREVVSGVEGEEAVEAVRRPLAQPQAPCRCRPGRTRRTGAPGPPRAGARARRGRARARRGAPRPSHRARAGRVLRQHGAALREHHERAAAVRAEAVARDEEGPVDAEGELVEAQPGGRGLPHLAARWVDAAGEVEVGRAVDAPVRMREHVPDAGGRARGPQLERRRKRSLARSKRQIQRGPGSRRSARGSPPAPRSADQEAETPK